MKMPTFLEKLMFGFIESQILFVCHELKVFDCLIENGPASIEQLSQRLHVPASSLERLLIGAHCIDLIKKRMNQYEINPNWASFLYRHSPDYCGGKFTHYFKTSYKIFDDLLTAVQENKAQTGSTDVYKDFIYADETSTADFLSTMWASGYVDSTDLCRKFSFANYKKLVDLGGATGSFAIAAVQENPELTATIMDYPAVKPYAQAKIIEHQLQDRVNFLAGDIFAESLPEGDVYTIGYLLSDLPKSHCHRLIQAVYDNLPDQGLIVILEKLFDEDKTGPYLTAMLNLTMLLEMHGKHRTGSAYLNWLQKVGFTDTQVIYSAGEKHMIVGKKTRNINTLDI